MNKTVVFVAFLGLLFLTLIEVFVLLIFAPEHFATFSSFVLVIIGLASTFAVTLWQQKKTTEEIANVKEETSTKLDVVQRQTNGTLTRLTDKIEEQHTTILKKDRRIADLEAALLHRPMKGIIND